MDILNKTIKKLSEDEYQALLMQVSGKKKNKPFLVLETTRQRDVDDSEMMEMLQVNASTYYTLKSRLNSKIAAILSKNVQNPISVLMDEVTRVPAILYGTNRDFSIRALKELEKQLIEYDLSSELIIVYKTLSQLHLYDEQFEHYDKLYRKHVAFSLAVSKAEGLYYRFIVQSGQYLLTHSEIDREQLLEIQREVANICELYNSHRLFVIYNLIRISAMCVWEEGIEGLKASEMEVDNTLQEMNRIFNKYNLDTFYQNIRFITDFLYFNYYQKTGNQVRADFYHDKCSVVFEELCPKHMMSYYMIRFLEGKVDKFLSDGKIEKLTELNDTIKDYMDVSRSETYQFIALKRYTAICKFYQRDYSGAARTINDLRNQISLKQHPGAEVECKLFQALNYCILGEDGLCMQIISSLKRQINDEEPGYENIRRFIKIIKAALKPADYRKKIKKITEMWNDFRQNNTGEQQILRFVTLDEQTLRRMTNPIKE